MKKYIAKSIFALGTLLLTVSCNSFLETTPASSISDKIVWKDIKSVEMYVNGFYPYIDRYGSFGDDQFSGSLTEGLTETFKYGSYATGSMAGDANNYVFTPELMSPTGNLLGTWSNTYTRIRRVNEFLVSLNKYSELTEEQNKLMEGQARFFRAFLYFQLAKRHGGVILYTDMNLEKNKARSTAAETWDLIEQDLDYAASVLPKAWSSDGSGRVTKGAAFALQSRAMLYAERWQKVVNAADSVEVLGIYSLTSNYKDAWKGDNSESILQYKYLTTGPNHSFDRNYAPYGDIENEGGKGTPTQEMVEAYEKADGTKIDWTPWHGTTTTTPPYSQLEPRFQATIIYNGSTWKGHTMQNSVGGNYGRFMGYREDVYAKGRTVTGYYLRKLMNESHTDLITYKSTQTWVEIRLAEVFLNRAEAYYRLNKEGMALADMNRTRTRPGVNLPEKQNLTGSTLFNAIRQERKIELAYEGHLYWDMRRWKLAHVEYNNYRTHGIKISPSGTGYTYEYVDCDLQDRKFLQKTYVLPVPYSELANNALIEQYDEWK
jgi:hypothetical protein